MHCANWLAGVSQLAIIQFELMSILQALRKAEAWLDEHRGLVVGVGQGERNGKPVIIVHATDQSVAESLPASLDGYDVVVEVGGEFTSF